MKNLRALLEHEIKDLYSAEKQLIDALPKTAEAASDSKLKSAIKSHLQETKKQFATLEKICKKMNIDPSKAQCQAMKGLIQECEKMIKEKADSDVKDAGLIACAQRIEHYEISGYGTARHFAKEVGEYEVAEKLEEILDQEKQANEKLNDLAIERINKKAKAS